jgi:hypothetical protein
MRTAIVVFVCVAVMLSVCGCNTVPVTPDRAEQMPGPSEGLDPAVAVLIVVLGLLLGVSLGGG